MELERAQEVTAVRRAYSSRINIPGALALVCLTLSAAGCARAQPEYAAPVPTDPESLTAARERMVDDLIARGFLKTERIIKVMRTVPRHEYVPRELWAYAYADHPLPIGNDQTISAPSIVAVMTELIEPRPDSVVLEIGTGSGYQASVLASLCKRVYTIEIVPELGNRARETLKRLGVENAEVRVGDGYRGWPEHAPFDGIMVTCAPEKVPKPLVEQLKEGGRMVIPVGTDWGQELRLLTKRNGKLESRGVFPVMFVPMTGEVQQQAD